MLYDVGLTIEYTYARSAAAGRHALRLMPASLPGEQRVIAASIGIDPKPDELVERRDFFGNAVTTISYRAPHTEIIFALQARVERTGAEPALDISPRLDQLAAEIEAVRTLEPAAPVHFLGASPRITPAPAFHAYAMATAKPGMTALAAIEAVGRALHGDMRFDAEATTVDTPPLEAFENRHGVCQDFTHVMISCLRALGIPAGYVSGFLRTIPPPGEARLEGADAMHAWVRAWAGVDVGWVEYDPTNALWAAADHIVVARGRDYADVAPVKGVLRTAGGQTSEQRVDVVPLER